MSSDQRDGTRGGSGVPSMLDLVRLSARPLFPPGGRELYRHVAILTDMKEGTEVLVAACGLGVTLGYFVREFGVHGSGVDEDPSMIAHAERRARAEGLQTSLQFQRAPMDALPYRDGVFDVAVGELGLTAVADPAEAIRELVRVVRPGGRVVLVQPVWKAAVDEERQALLARHLGATPLMMVEAKRILRELGVRRLHTEAWSDEETAFRKTVRKPFPDFAELFTVPQKLGILRRARKRWGWKGVRKALQREREVHRLLTHERILGLDMVSGRKVEQGPEPEPEPKPKREPDPEPEREPEPEPELQLGLEPDREAESGMEPDPEEEPS